MERINGTMKIKKLFAIIITIFIAINAAAKDTDTSKQGEKQLAYIVSDVRIPFWNIMSRGIESKAQSLGYTVQVYSADNMMKTELENVVKSIRYKVDGVIISPISSSTASTILKLTKRAKIPTVISDIGADSVEYVSYISSDNFQGAYDIGQVLTQKMQKMKWQGGSVGIISIPQKRANGKARTSGFMRALDEAGIKISGLLQQVDFSYQETYAHALTLIKNDQNLRALWLQGSDRYQGALDAISDSGKKEEILLICFDAEPEFIQMITEGELVGAAMQQPFLMGEKAVEVMDKHLEGEEVPNMIQMPILAISNQNIATYQKIIRRNVLGISDK